MTGKTKSKTIRLSPLYKKHAELKVLSAIRMFLYANPEFEGNVNIPIISIDKEELSNPDDDRLQRLALEAECLIALSHSSIQSSVQKAAKKEFERLKKIVFEVMDYHAYAELVISLPPPPQE